MNEQVDESQHPGVGPASGPVSGAPARRLVRDPDATLGGVASGLGHYFGVDVSLVRLAFVLLTFTSGIGLVAYLLAWLVVPRATVWPPDGQAQPVRSIDGREVAVGLLILGALAALFFNGGGTARIVVPALLMAGGVWLLRQTPAPDPTSGALLSTDPAWSPPRADDLRSPEGPFSSSEAAQPADTIVDEPAPSAASDTPGPGVSAPRPRRRRILRRVLIALLVLFFVVPVLLIVLVIGLVLGNGVDLDPGFEATYRPAVVADLAAAIDHDTGSITLDLTELDLDGFDDPRTDLPVPMDLDLGFGELIVVVPAGLDVDVDAEAGLGDVTVFGDGADGINPRVQSTVDDPQIELDLRVGAGEVTVRRR